MKLLACLSTIAMTLMLYKVEPKAQEIIPDDVFNSDTQLVTIKKSNYYSIGDIDFKTNAEKNAFYSPMRVRFDRNVRNPRAKITIYYTNKENQNTYLFNRKDISRTFNERYKEFYIRMSVPLSDLAPQAKVYIVFEYTTRNDITAFNFNISNPLATIVGDGGNLRIYNRFSKSFTSSHGFTQYSNVMVFKKNNYDDHEFYYDHLDIGANLAIRTPLQYSVHNLCMVFDNHNLGLFNDVTHKVNGSPLNYVYLNLLSLQRKTDFYVDIGIDGELYYDPTTNLMSFIKNQDYLKAGNKFYLPLGYYETFKNFTYYLVFDYEVALVNYRIALKSNVVFDKNLLKDRVLVVKTNEKIVDENLGGQK